MKLPLKIELPVFDLRIDRNIQKIEYYLELRESDFTYHCELYADKYPEEDEGEFGIKEGVFIYRRFIGERKNICGIDVIYKVNDKDDHFECFEIYIEQRGVSSECTIIKVQTMEKANEIQNILLEYKVICNSPDRSPQPTGAIATGLYKHSLYPISTPPTRKR